MTRRLYDGAVKKVGGRQNLQGEVCVTENFYFDKDGLHFVYNSYEIACGATGDVEVLIDLKALCTPAEVLLFGDANGAGTHNLTMR